MDSLHVVCLAMVGLAACSRKDVPSGNITGPSTAVDGAAPSIGATASVGAAGPATSATQPLVAPPAPGRTLSLVARLTAPRGAFNDKFGAALALEGKILTVGAPYRDEPSLDAGVVYVFQRDAQRYRLLQTLRSPRPTAHFGEVMVMMDGKLLVSRAFPPYEELPRWFVLRDEAFVAEGSLEPPKSVMAADRPAAHFGNAFAVHGGRLLVGARGKYGLPGRAFLLRSESGKLEPEFRFDPESSPDFESYNFYMGDALALDDRHVALVATQDPRKSSSVVVFRKEGDGWRHSQTIPHAPGEVALSGSFLFVGSGGTQKPVTVYHDDGPRWTLVQEIGQALSVAADGDLVALSDGALYHRDGSRFIEVQHVAREQGRRFSGAGPVMLRGGVLVIGEPEEGGKGAVYVYEATN